MSENNISVERDFVGTLHIKVGDFDYVQIQYQHPLTDNASTRALADRIVALLAQPAEAEGVEVRALQWLDTGHYRKKPPQFGYNPHDWNPLMTVAQHQRILSAVTAERDRLQAALSAPDTITAEPAGDYDNLRKQFQSLRMLANSNAKMVHHWRAQCGRETRETLLANAASVNAERDTNSMLTDALETAERERDRLRAEVEALRAALHGIASVNPAERGIEWAKSYASDGLKGAGSALYARWLEAFKEAEALRKAFMRMRNVAAGYSNCCEFDSANTRRLEREFEAADELFRSSAAMAAKEA